MELIKNAVVVTRHTGLVSFLKEEGIIDDTATILTHASVEDVQGKDVIGVLPHSLSCHTRTFSEVPLAIPAEMRGKELTTEQVRQYASPLVTYEVNVMT